MSAVPCLKHFRVKRCALLLGCLLAQQGVFAHSGQDAIFFQVASLASPDIVTTARSAGGAQQQEAASFAAFAPLTGDAASIRSLITRLEESGDFYSPGIAELAEQLGKALQAAGQHDAALEAYDRSFQIMRRQEGLFSTAQASILQAKIGSHLALNDMEAGDALQHTLFLMQQQLLAEKPVALAEAHLASADWNMNYYLQALQAPVPGGRTEAQATALAERLAEAFMQYHKALGLLSSTSSADDLYEKKVAIERRIAALTLMVNRQYQRETPNLLTKPGQHSANQNRHANHPALSNHGSAALLRAVEYSMAMAEPVKIAERQLELADWYLLMDQHDEARAAYATALASLRDAGIPQPQIAAMLESGSPVQDPETALLALARQQSVNDFDGYVDVTLDINRYGKASNTRVLAGASYDDSYDKKVERDLLREIDDSRFRPGFDQGRPVARKDVTLRYYFAR